MLFRPILVLALSLAPTTAQAIGQAPVATRLDEIEQLIGKGQYSAAEAALRSLDGGGGRSDYLLGFTLLQLYRFDEAETVLQRAVDHQPGQHAWLHALAKAQQERGRNLAAIGTLDRAVAIEPDPDYLYARAMCALNVGDLDSAETDLRRCLASGALNPQALYNLGKILVDRGEYGGSLELLRSCLEQQPSHLEARFLLGLAASHTGDPPTAQRAFEEVIDRVPGHVGARYNLGRVLIELGRQEEGLARLEEFRSLSQLRDRIDFFTQAVKKNPRNREGRLGLSRMLLEAGRTEEALQEILAARQLAPRDAEIYRLLATAFRRLGRDVDAARADAFAHQLATGR